MVKVKTTLRKAPAFVLMICLAAISISSLTTTANAAGKGYSDAYRMYSIEGLNKDPYEFAEAVLYGSPDNSPDDNYAVVIMADERKKVVAADIMSETDFNTLMRNSVSTTQLEVDNYNELMLSQGADESWLLLSEKPEIINEINQAVAKKKSIAAVKGYMAIAPDALKYAAEIGGNDFQISFDSTDYETGKKVVGRMTVTASKTTNGLVTLLEVESDYIDDALARLAKTYKNKVAAIDFFQKGSFGTSVRVAAKVNLSGFDTSKLYFYSQDTFTRKITRISEPNYSYKDGFVYFNTTLGGTILISEKELSK